MLHFFNGAKIVLLFVGLLILGHAGAQSCDNFPADCPDNGLESAQDSDVCINNMILPQEISMQHRLRDKLTALMNDISKRNKWQVYAFLEEAGSGIMVNDKPLPYAYRRPYQCGFSFIFIVNEDSLHAWQNWYNNDLQNASNKVVDAYKQSGNAIAQDDNRQKYLDSANYYGNQKTKYMTDHFADYQKALQANDTKGQKKYEADIKRYDDKINACINKTNDKAAQGFSSSKSQFDDLETYKHKNTIAFRNGSIMRVSFSFNDYIAIADDEEKKLAGTLSIPAAAFGTMIHNNKPDEHEIFGQYLRSPDMALLLFGKWLLKQDEYHSYHSLYYGDKKNTDAVTIKKIPCDKVQTVIMHVEGSTNYINRFLKTADLQTISRLVDGQ